LRQHILKSGGHMAQSMQRGAHYLLVLTNMLRTSDANRVSYLPTRGHFFVLAGLINIELLGRAHKRGWLIFKNLFLMLSTYYISKTGYFISQQYIVLRSNLVDLTKIYF
jgi:hypothetical protein